MAAEEKIEELHGLMKKLRDELKDKDNTMGEVNQKVHNLQDRIDELEDELQKENDFQKKLNQRLPFANGNQEEKEVGPSDEYKAFMKYARKGTDGTSVEERKDLSVADDEGGGYLVPEDYRQELIQSLPDKSVMRDNARIITTSRDGIKVPTVDGSMSWYWTDEVSLPTSSDESFGQLVIPVHTTTGLIKTSRQLLEDSAFNMEQFIQDEFSDSLALEEDDVYLTGNGQSKPEGLLTNSDIQSNRVIKTDSSGTLGADDVIDLEYNVEEKYAGNAVFMARRKIVRELRKLKDQNDNYYYGSPANAEEPATFDGYPIVKPSTALDNEVSSGNQPIIFGDFSHYWVVDRVDMSMQRLNEKYAPQIGMLFRVRRGGKVTLPEAFSVLEIQ